jgi:integrase/recombinase XerC
MDQRNELTQFAQYLQRRSPGRRTAIDYVSDVRQFAASCSKPWHEVTMHDIDAFVDQQHQAGLSAATVKRRVAALRVFFDFLAEESDDLAWPNPVRFKRHAGKQAHTLPRDLKDADIEQLWAVISSPRDRAWFALMLRAGLRVGEVVGLTAQDVLAPPQASQPARLRVLGKGRKERLVLLTADAYAVLQAWLQQRPPSAHAEVFLNEQGQPLSANGIEWLLHGYGAQVGLDLTPHQLRHTYARQLTEAGMPLTSLGKLMGHAQITTTQIYTAGADPQLAAAYQQAMARLAERPALTLSAAPPAPVGPPAAPYQPPACPAPPDWAAWAVHLPPTLREASVAYVQSQRLQALKLLGQLRRFFEWLLARRVVSQLADVHLADVQAYQSERTAAGLGVHSVDASLSCVLAMLRHQAEQGQVIDSGVLRLRPRPRPESLPRHLSEAESQALERYLLGRLDSADAWERLENACLFVLAHGGLRASECVELTFQDLDLSGQRLWVRQAKGRKDRLVYLTETACQALARYLDGAPRAAQAPLFTFPYGRPISYGWLRIHVAQLGQAAGLTHVSPHRLRHTLATRLLNAGMEVTRIQKLLGHRYLNTTLIYARVADTTVETDYRQAMGRIERQQMPLSNAPVPTEWPTVASVDAPLAASGSL